MKTELVKAVKDHALANYTNGWDFIIECYTDKEIAEVIGGARTVKGALKKFAELVEIRDEQASNCRFE